MMFFLLFLLPYYLFSSAKPDFFRQFPNRFFVETGSYLGHGIEMALQAGFTEIHSIELGEKFYRDCLKKFASHPQVHLWWGDSGLILGHVIQNMMEPITFWLDGHWSNDGTAKGATYTPILQELAAIHRHPIKTHTILIDDIRCFGTSDFDDIELSTLIQKILEINPQYVISFQEGHQPNDILIAQIPHP